MYKFHVDFIEWSEDRSLTRALNYITTMAYHEYLIVKETIMIYMIDYNN